MAITQSTRKVQIKTPLGKDALIVSQFSAVEQMSSLFQFDVAMHSEKGELPADDILGPMYPKADLAAAEERLRDFLIGRFGGPTRYIEQRGHPRLRMRHAPFPIGRDARDRWMELMTKALDAAHLPPDVSAFLRDFFDAVATMMVNRGDETGETGETGR